MTIPTLTTEGIDRYVKYRLPPGSFLRAVLEDNLAEAYQQADDSNREAFPQVVQKVRSEVPESARGNATKVRAWLQGKN